MKIAKAKYWIISGVVGAALIAAPIALPAALIDAVVLEVLK
jgi:hypothetical protein